MYIHTCIYVRSFSTYMYIHITYCIIYYTHITYSLHLGGQPCSTNPKSNLGDHARLLRQGKRRFTQASPAYPRQASLSTGKPCLAQLSPA